MRADPERKLHKLLQSHPYLIDKGLTHLKPASEVVMENGRIDLLFRKNRKMTIVELKKTIIKPRDLDQLARYWNSLSNEGLEMSTIHFLIGKKPNSGKAIQTLTDVIESLPFSVRLKYLFWDIPHELIWDSQKDRYVAQTDDRLADANYHHPFKIRI